MKRLELTDLTHEQIAGAKELADSLGVNVDEIIASKNVVIDYIDKMRDIHKTDYFDINLSDFVNFVHDTPLSVKGKMWAVMKGYENLQDMVGHAAVIKKLKQLGVALENLRDIRNPK